MNSSFSARLLNRSLIGAIGLNFIALCSSVPVNAAIIIQEGYDLFLTGGAGKNFAALPISGGFFDPGSSDFSDLIVFEGDHLTSFKGIPLPQGSQLQPENFVDTIVHRLDDAILNGIGSETTIDIQMADLGLKSFTPIEITNSFGQIEQWDVNVRATNNPVGSMTIRQEFSNGGTYDAIIPIDGMFTFTRRSDGSIREIDAGSLPTLVMEINNVPWVETPVSQPLNSNFTITSVPGLTTNFVAGYSPDQGRQLICGEADNPNNIVAGRALLAWHGHAFVSPTPEPLLTNIPFECRESVPEFDSRLSLLALIILGGWTVNKKKSRLATL